MNVYFYFLIGCFSVYTGFIVCDFILPVYLSAKRCVVSFCKKYPNFVSRVFILCFSTFIIGITGIKSKNEWVDCISISIALTSGFFTVYAIFYGIASARYNSRDQVIASLTNTAIDSLKTHKDATLAAQAMRMELIPLPDFLQIWDVFKYRSHFSNLIKHEPEFKDYNEKTGIFTMLVGNKEVKIENDNWDKLYEALKVRVDSVREIKAVVETMAKNYGFVPKNVADEINDEVSKLDISRMSIQHIQYMIKNQFKKADASQTNLSRLWLHGVSVDESCFHGANLEYAQFDKSNLNKAKFHGASLLKAQFNESNLSFTHFYGSNLSCAKFHGAILTNVWFYGSWLKLAEFHEANLFFAKFNKANLNFTQFHRSHLFATKFHGADLDKAEFHEAYIQLADKTQTLLEHIEEHKDAPEGKKIRTDLGFPDFTGVQNLHTSIFHKDVEKDIIIIGKIAEHFKIQLPHNWKDEKRAWGVKK